METMILLHESNGRAFTLPAAAVARRLCVVAGEAWVTQTRRGRRTEPPEDLWLGVGDTLPLPAGSAWVVQAHGELRLRLCQPGAIEGPVRPAAWRWLRALRAAAA
jgi:hypothetical protein